MREWTTILTGSTRILLMAGVEHHQQQQQQHHPQQWDQPVTWDAPMLDHSLLMCHVGNWQKFRFKFQNIILSSQWMVTPLSAPMDSALPRMDLICAPCLDIHVEQHQPPLLQQQLHPPATCLQSTVPILVISSLLWTPSDHKCQEMLSMFQVSPQDAFYDNLKF